MSLTEANTEPEKAARSGAVLWPLIGPGDPSPFTIFNEHGQAPFLLVCDHASRAFPRSMNQLGVPDTTLETHVAWDIGSDKITRHLARRFNAPAVLAGYSRLIVDLNRPLHDRTAFIKVSDGIAIPGNLDLDDEQKTLRSQSFFKPYHDAISHKLDEYRSRGQVPALISIHTCTPVYDRAQRKWEIGVMWDKDPRIATPLIERLNSMDDICVGDNEPYSGQHPNDFTVDHHGEQTGLPCVGIEIRQDLVETQQGVARWGDILANALEGILAESALYRLLD